MAKELPKRLEFIEGMRGIAALYVVLQHIVTLTDPYGKLPLPGAIKAVMGSLLYGHFAVSAFIVLSGFCLQMALFQRGDGTLTDVESFLIRRCRRILPPYYACLAFSVLVVLTVTTKQSGMPWEQYLPLTTENLMAHVLMIHNFSRDWMYKINGVLWSISIEFQLYFLFPLICAAMVKFGILRSLICSGLIATGCLLLFPVTEKLYIWYFGLFVLGMASARWTFDQQFQGLGLRRFGFGSFGLFLLACLSTQWTKELAIRDLLMGGSIALMLVYCSKDIAGWLPRLLSNRMLAVLGTFSYSLYLIHHPILQIVYVSRPVIMQTPLRSVGYMFSIGLLMAIACSFVFFWFFERPFLRSKSSQPS
ncbi:MAG: acyltransferase [Armatimonadetes bacterium]|nr:acyltransferase [Armatimonadota bacterium]